MLWKLMKCSCAKFYLAVEAEPSFCANVMPMDQLLTAAAAAAAAAFEMCTS